MKHTRLSFQAIVCLLLLGSLLFTSCSAPTGNLPDQTDPTTDDTTADVTESESDSLTETETQVPDTKIEGALPDESPKKTFACHDGLMVSSYSNQSETDFKAACAYFEEDGYTLYCSRDTENTLSATYIKDDAYSTLLFRKGWKDLNIGLAESGGKTFPAQNQPYEKLYETAVTQPGLPGNGLCEIIRLADGSFLVFDSGTNAAASTVYQELCRLNGSSTNIHIRAWVLTHSHSDHYGGFVSLFSEYKYRNSVKLDMVLYAPVARNVADTLKSYNTSWDGIDYYFTNTFPTFMKNMFPDTVLCSVHAGQTFTFADVELQILYTSEYLYMNEIPVDFNNTSIVSRVVNQDGSMVVMADCGANAADWINKTYKESELKSDFMQVTHHGMVTNYDLNLMYKINPSTYLWPCSEDFFSNYWGISCYAKQYAIARGENVIHGYGSATRKLSYRGTRPVGTELLTETTAVTGNNVKLLETDGKTIQFTVTDATDPYVTLPVYAPTAQYNALRIRVSCSDYKNGSISWTSGAQKPFSFTSANTRKLGPQGTGRGSSEFLLVFLGNGESFYGAISSLRLDLGEVVGETVTIYSIEAIYVEVDP